jgi:thiamine monophosphate synthase
MPFAPQGLLQIGGRKKKIGNLPLVAIGGISLERIAGVFEAGADSTTVVTDVTRNVDPEARGPRRRRKAACNPARPVWPAGIRGNQWP